VVAMKMATPIRALSNITDLFTVAVRYDLNSSRASK
jgi:hypothetical protein